MSITNWNGQLTVLGAEVGWRREEPQLVRVEASHGALRSAAAQGKRIGLALRIGGYGGRFRADDRASRFLAELASSLVMDFTTNGLPPTELQLDFDCAESKLGGYRLWVEAIRNKIAPVPLTITALPAWLNRGEFRKLIEATDGYVLQVHSLERPKNVKAEFSLCDPLAARGAVERAGRYKKGFRVALPTYGYLVAFNSQGEFAGLSAEGPSVAARNGVRVREVRADPAAMAELVRIWESDRPAAMKGLAWYRLPMATDRLNWRWPTLMAVMKGRVPRPELRVVARRPQTGLTEIDLVNTGEAGYSGGVRVVASWGGANMVAADGLQGFEVHEGEGNIELHSDTLVEQLEPGERRQIAWVRLANESEVRVQIVDR